MSDIPEDVMARAVELCWLKSPSPLRDQVADHLARAILQERERCAMIAEHFAQQWATPRGYETEACLQVAAAIRSGKP